MSEKSGVLGLICWGISIPLQVWGGLLGGPTPVYITAMVTFVLGLVLFTMWAMAGGMPPMRVR